MFPWRRKLPMSSVVAFLVAGVCAAGAFVLVAGQARRVHGAGPTVAVVIAARDLAPGVAVGPDDVALRDLPADVLPAVVMRDPTEVIGRITVTPFGAGEPVTTARLALAGGPLTASVPPGSVAVPIQPDQVPAGVAAGDRVDVYATYLTARPYTATVGEDLVVLAADTGDTGTGTAPTGLVLLADTFTAAELTRADATATVAVAVRGFVPLP